LLQYGAIGSQQNLGDRLMDAVSSLHKEHRVCYGAFKRRREDVLQTQLRELDAHGSAAAPRRPMRTPRDLVTSGSVLVAMQGALHELNEQPKAETDARSAVDSVVRHPSSPG
jgi:hypothetical protein